MYAVEVSDGFVFCSDLGGRVPWNLTVEVYRVGVDGAARFSVGRDSVP